MKTSHYIRGKIITKYGSMTAWTHAHTLNYQVASALINGRKTYKAGLAALIKDGFIESSDELPQYKEEAVAS